MIRARFLVNGVDYRPVSWPIKHPYWCSGYTEVEGTGEDFAILVAYADDEAEILRLWPDARDIDAEPASEYRFTSRFPEPDWWKAQQQVR